MAKIGFNVTEEEQKRIGECIEFLHRDGHKVLMYRCEEIEDRCYQLASQEGVEILVGFNYNGLQYRTLTGGMSANCYGIKVMHVITEDQFIMREHLKKVISISQFFYFAVAAVMDEALRAYPHIPYAKYIPELLEDDKINGTALYSSICEVVRMCHLD